VGLAGRQTVDTPLASRSHLSSRGGQSRAPTKPRISVPCVPNSYARAICLATCSLSPHVCCQRGACCVIFGRALFLELTELPALSVTVRNTLREQWQEGEQVTDDWWGSKGGQPRKHDMRPRSNGVEAGQAPRAAPAIWQWRRPNQQPPANGEGRRFSGGTGGRRVRA
jgi:hypothetical protein